MNDFLQLVVAAAKERLGRESPDERALRKEASAAVQGAVPFRFSAALKRSAPPAIHVIAEIKSASPTAGIIVADPDVEAIAGDYRRGGASAISVVTEPQFFRGSRSWIRRAAAAAGLPVIMKDFVIDPVQLLEGVAAGADAMLLLASLCDARRIRESIALLDEFGCDALVEVHDERELERAVEGGARLVGVNNRDLRTFRVDLATAERLARSIPADRVRVAESGIQSRTDVERLERAGFHGILVGESLLRRTDREKAVAELLGPGAVQATGDSIESRGPQELRNSAAGRRVGSK